MPGFARASGFSPHKGAEILACRPHGQRPPETGEKRVCGAIATIKRNFTPSVAFLFT
jgi:hypothetical protein